MSRVPAAALFGSGHQGQYLVYLGVCLNERTRSLRGSAENEASSKPLEALEKAEAVSAQKDAAGGQSDTFG